MDTIAAAQIALRPLDHDIIQRAGVPGSPARVAVYNALNILGQGRGYRPRGRGPSLDFLGFVREVVSETMAACEARLVPLDDFAVYSDDFERGLTVDQFRELVQHWGMREIAFASAKPGDILVFAMPRVHAGIKLPDIETGTVTKSCMEPRMASAVWGRPPGQQFVVGQWAERAATAFTWAAR